MQEQNKQRLPPTKINYALAYAIRFKSLFTYASQHLKINYFPRETEFHYALLWSATLAAAKLKNNSLPEDGTAGQLIAMELITRIDDYGNVPQDVGKIAESLLRWIFSLDISELNEEVGKELLKELIIERSVIAEMDSNIELFKAGSKPADLIKNLTTYTNKLQSLLVDANKVGQTAFPRDFKPKKLGKFSTGLLWFDRFMNGGQAPGEVYVILGPTGLGKTTTGIMLTVSTARVLATENNNKISCFFSWEQDLDRLRLRFWSYAARIDSSRLEAYADELITLSTKPNPEDYELEEFSDEIRLVGVNNIPCEHERLEAVIKELSDTVQIFDFSGAAENPRLGEGGIDEVAASLRSLQQSGKEIGVVVLDYAGAAVKRMLAGRGEDPSHIRHYLANFCNECRFKIALPFNCPVWVLHQLNTESNRRAPTAEQHHSFASEAGNFAENAWFAFVFSTKDKINNTCQLFCTKERRAKGDRPPAILKIAGEFGRLEDASNTYRVVPEMRQIMPGDIANRRVIATNEDLRERMAQRRSNSNSFTERFGG